MVRADLYYDKDGVKVTSKEFILNSSRYKLSDVNAVYVSKRANYRRYPITFGVLSFFFGLLMVGGSMGVALFFLSVWLNYAYSGYTDENSICFAPSHWLGGDNSIDLYRSL